VTGGRKSTKTSCRGIEQVREARKSKKKPGVSFLDNDSEKYSSSLSRQLSETKPNTKLILLCHEFNKSNKQSVCYINLFKTFNFSQS